MRFGRLDHVTTEIRQQDALGADLFQMALQYGYGEVWQCPGLDRKGRKNMPKEFTPAELERWSIASDTPAGRLCHLRPAGGLSETPPLLLLPAALRFYFAACVN
ncbi:MAG TPA: hypothetical protein VLQ80_31010 [Candidatus Saccharimonadia bacterium]|nr:hypothetical protein [Candidatus Saccharimonadia bacterium]